MFGAPTSQGLLGGGAGVGLSLSGGLPSLGNSDANSPHPMLLQLLSSINLPNLPATSSNALMAIFGNDSQQQLGGGQGGHEGADQH